jgi:hypothetical protein
MDLGLIGKRVPCETLLKMKVIRALLVALEFRACSSVRFGNSLLTIRCQRFDPDGRATRITVRETIARTGPALCEAEDSVIFFRDPEAARIVLQRK